MNGFLSSFIVEYKKNLYRMNMILWLIILVSLLYIANSEFNVIEHNQDKIDAFKKIQKSSFEDIKNYLMYQVHGFDILYVIPNPSVISSETTIPDDLSSKIDGFSKVQISNNFKCKVLASQGKGIKPGIAVIIKLLISLMAIWNGFVIVQKMDFLKSLSSIWSCLKSFLYTTIPRFLLFTLTFLLVMGIVFLFIWIRGVTFNIGEISVIAGFLLNAVVFLGIFFFLGALFGMLNNKTVAIFLIFIYWFGINIANYWFIKPTVEPGFPDALKDFQTVLDIKTIFTDFEIYAENQYGKFDRKNIEMSRKVIEDLWKNYYLEKISPLHKKLMDMIASSFKKDCSISKFFPGLFFDMTANEASGRGYESYLRFYDYSMEMQAKFVRFIIDRAYYNDPKVMVNFIKDDEDIFYGKGSLPPNFMAGIFIQLGYLVILIFACFICYKRKMFPRAKDAKAFEGVEIDLKSGENFTMHDYTDDETLIPQLINVFLKENRELPLKLTLDGKPFTTGERRGIIFVPKAKQIPGELKGKHLVCFFKRVFNLASEDITRLENEIGKKTLDKHFCKMKKEEAYKLVLTLYFLCKFPIYLFDNFIEGIPSSLSDELIDIVTEKLPAGSMIVDFTVSEKRWNNQLHWCAVHFKDGKYRVFKEK